MRVLVTGSRKWRGTEEIRKALDEAYAESHPDPLVLVHGNCPTGVDRRAFDWAIDMVENGFDVRVEPHPAKWNGPKGKGAGFARNAEMVKLGADLCLAFILDESPGATHTEQLARKAGIKTKTFRRSTKVPGKTVNRSGGYIPDIQPEGVRILYRNFEGREEFNVAGNRNFSVVLPEDIALGMIEQGWNVKSKPPRPDVDGDETFYYMKVKVSYKIKAPRVTMVTKKWDPKLGAQKLMRTSLDEDLIQLLDVAEFDNIELILTPSRWTVRGESGVTAYLKTGFFFIYQDPLEERYAGLPYADQEDRLAIEGPDPANDWIDGESSDWEEDDEDPWTSEEEKDQRGLTGTSR